MPRAINHKIVIGLIILDLAWAAMAALYDWEIFCQIPVYLWPFLVICPVFPALLALVWAQSLDSRPNSLLLAFSAIPSFLYFFAALIYYPTWMIINGFDWMTFGAIFWVLAYGLQAFYLLSKYRIRFFHTVIIAIFLFVSFVIQYKTKTYGAQDFANFPVATLLIEYFAVSFFALSFPYLYYFFWERR